MPPERHPRATKASDACHTVCMEQESQPCAVACRSSITNDKCGIVVLARTGSRRLPQKMTLPFWNGKSVLVLLLESMAARFGPSRLVLATTNQESDACLCLEAEKRGIAVWKGSENDVLQRCIDAAKHMSWESCIRVCADNPFLSMDALLDLHRLDHRWDYASFFFSDGLPAIRSHCGFFAERIKVSALEVCARSPEGKHHEHVTNFIYENPQSFRICKLQVPDEVLVRKIRLTVDTEKDFNRAQEMYRTKCSLQLDGLHDLLQHLRSSPALIADMKADIHAHPK